MTHVNKVMRSTNSADGSHCVDIFVRPDGTFGFEEYRRDVEDLDGWFPIGRYDALIFASEGEALLAAEKSVVWFAETSARESKN